jgi:hypothetical protein
LLVKVSWADRVMALPFCSKRFYADKTRAPKTLLDWARQPHTPLDEALRQTLSVLECLPRTPPASRVGGGSD